MATVSGTVKDSTGAFAARMVRAYRRSDGAFAGEVASNATTGAYSITALDGTPHFAVVHDGSVTIGGDTYWNNVVLAMHMDASGFPDAKGHTPTVTSVSLDTTNYAPLTGNAASALFNGTKSRITFPKSTDTSGFAASDVWSIGMWVRQVANTTGCLLSLGASSGTVAAQFSVETSGANQNVYIRPQGGTAGSWIRNAWAFDTNWHYLEFVSTGSALIIRRDGVTAGSPESFSWTTAVPADGLLIGASYTTTYETFFAGNIDDLLITKGVARAAPVPSVPFLESATSIGTPTENALIFDNITPV